jgi:hypothetical protein
MEAKTCIVEHHYVCLDYRSELSSFAAQLDAESRNSASRLHFFAEVLEQDDLIDLSEVADSYLGYIVCRPGNQAPVGRAVLRTPDYIHTSTSVREPVNLLGQHLKVIGTPFMQQDERHAVCADVAVWTVAYTFYRRGIIARNLIADIVRSVRSQLPMSPTTPTGGSTGEICEVFNKLHIGTRANQTNLTGYSDFPKINGHSMPFDRADVAALLPLILKAGEDSAPSESVAQKNYETFLENPMLYIDDILKILQGDLGVTGGRKLNLSDAEIKSYTRHASRLLNEVYAYLLTPYLESGFPVVCCPLGHAMVLVGISRDDEGPIFYFNDDQFGPYLASRSFTGTTAAGFQRQAYAGKYRKELDGRAPTTDYARKLADVPKSDGWLGDRGPRVVITPTPSRLLLSPVKAQQNAVDQLMNVLSESLNEIGRELTTDSLPSKLYRIRTVILMGIDYKVIRRRQSGTDSVGRRLFSLSHLSEWVIIVEGQFLNDSPSGAREVEWEIVYDGTSADTNPLVQLARVQRMCMTVHPQDAGKVSVCSSEQPTLPPVSIPLAVGKSVIQNGKGGPTSHVAVGEEEEQQQQQQHE